MKLCILFILCFPYIANAGETINRPWYTLDYNEQHEVANWVAYSLDSSQQQNCVPRRNSFRVDPLVSTGSAEIIDYANSGFDRGHLLPAGDMKFDAQAMRDSFYLSNITPQPAGFNRGRWGQLENLIRAWTSKYGKLWIVTGPVLRTSLGWIGQNNRVSVPEEYFKVILRKENSGYKGIAFLMATDVPFPELEPYSLEIDSIENLTKINFFPFLGEAHERESEGSFNVNDWDFTARFDYLPCSTSEAL
ncbi:MAG TPA: DNA/RNA non-specific endonuclease [Bacteriovoracaceae bacterium]|nr:DNA/RNA non-specific endonuclease [Bacteriovoracaceae bacterium]